MEVTHTTLAPQLLSLGGPKQVMQAWAVGQLLQASVVAHPRPGTVTLAIDGSQLQATTQHMLRSGETLTLRVESLGQQPVLSVIDARGSAAQTELQWLRVALPRQNALPPLLTQLGELGRGVSRELATVPEGIAASAARLVARLPSPRILATARGIAQAVWESGFFLEAKLAQMATGPAVHPLNQDLKAGLLRLLSVLTSPIGSTTQPPSAPPPNASSLSPPPQAPASGDAGQSSLIGKLVADVEGAVHRIQANQLRSVVLGEQVSPVWYFELPVRERRGVGLVSLRVGRERAGTHSQEGGTWTAHLALDLGDHGRASARIALSAGTVSSNLWAEQASTAELFARHIDDLRDALTTAGLKVGAICCHVGGSPAESLSEAYPSLLDVRA